GARHVRQAQLVEDPDRPLALVRPQRQVGHQRAPRLEAIPPIRATQVPGHQLALRIGVTFAPDPIRSSHSVPFAAVFASTCAFSFFPSFGFPPSSGSATDVGTCWRYRRAADVLPFFACASTFASTAIRSRAAPADSSAL